MNISLVRLLVLILAFCLTAKASAAPPHVTHSKKASKYASFQTLPRTHYRVVYQGNPYYYWGGHFYRHRGGSYLRITAPIGAIVPSLPGGFITIGVGSSRYFYFEGIYYRPAKSGYVVIEKPIETPAVLPVSEEDNRLIAYPKLGQSEEQAGRDRYECHSWASRETGFDPTVSGTDITMRSDYHRAMSACLEARGYVVK